MAYRRYPAGLIGVRPPRRTNIIMIICLFFLILAFIPLVQGVNALEGGTTLNGAIELALIGAGTALAALNVPAPAVTAAYLRLPAVMIGGGFAMWAMLTTAWSPNPILTAGKSLELGLIIVAAALVVRLSTGAPLGVPPVERCRDPPRGGLRAGHPLPNRGECPGLEDPPAVRDRRGCPGLRGGGRCRDEASRHLRLRPPPLDRRRICLNDYMYNVIRCAAGGEGCVLPAGPAGDLGDGLADLARCDPADPHVDGNQQAEKKRYQINYYIFNYILVAGPPGPGRRGGAAGREPPWTPRPSRTSIP